MPSGANQVTPLDKRHQLLEEAEDVQLQDPEIQRRALRFAAELPLIQDDVPRQPRFRREEREVYNSRCFSRVSRISPCVCVRE
jgi:hypothetical protein